MSGSSEERQPERPSTGLSATVGQITNHRQGSSHAFISETSLMVHNPDRQIQEIEK